MSNYPKKPKCDGGCQPPYTSFIAKSGKQFNKCVACENLVFTESQAKSEVGGKRVSENEDCDHVNKARVAKVSKAGKAYTVCAGCNQGFKWADTPTAPPPQVDNGGTTQLALSSVVADLQNKIDTAFKSILEIQKTISKQNERIDIIAGGAGDDDTTEEPKAKRNKRN